MILLKYTGYTADFDRLSIDDYNGICRGDVYGRFKKVQKTKQGCVDAADKVYKGTAKKYTRKNTEDASFEINGSPVRCIFA